MQATRKGSWLHGWSCQRADMLWMLWTKAQGWEIEMRLEAVHVWARCHTSLTCRALSSNQCVSVWLLASAVRCFP